MGDSRLGAVEAALRERRFPVAISLASAVIATPAAAPGDHRRALFLRAQAHEVLRDLPRAIADLRAALAIDGRDAPAHNRLGILLADATTTYCG